MTSCGGRGAELTSDERAVLAASAHGLLIHEVAALLEQPPGTTRQRLASAIQKLGAHSKLEAVVRAVRQGLISLS